MQDADLDGVLGARGETGKAAARPKASPAVASSQRRVIGRFATALVE